MPPVPRPPETADAHVVQLYSDERILLGSVRQWLAGLAEGGAAVVVCRPGHAIGLREELAAGGIDARHAEAEGRLLVLDAETTLETFFHGGRLHAARFRRVIREAVERARASSAAGTVRAWGEMVDILWQRGLHSTAHRLEELWNELIVELDLELLCSYRVDDLTQAAQESVLPRICATHLRLVPTRDAHALERAVDHALASVFSPEEAPTLRAVLERRPAVRAAMPAGERVLMGLHELHPDAARRVLAETRAFLDDVTGRAAAP